MIGLFIAIAGCVYFFLEAGKRDVSRVKWALIAFVAFMGPQILISWLAVPIVFAMLGISPEDNIGTQGFFAIVGLVIGFVLLVVARKKLYLHARTEPVEGAVVITSFDIAENEDGTFSVGDRKFNAKSEAEAYVDYVKDIRH